MLFNCFISHGYLPRDFLKTAIVLIIKNKSGNSSDKANYRPIALVTACSKIFESCLLIMLEKYLHTHDQQFVCLPFAYNYRYINKYHSCLIYYFNALKNAKTGKACGVDVLAAEHFIYADAIIHIHLSLLFNSFISHGYLPRDFMKTAIVSIVKNKSENSGDKANYRPIALVTACSKIFESCLLIMLEKYLHTQDQQFEFNSQHATDMCIFTVKSVIKYYTKQNSTVFTCFLDAAKAFDRVSHKTLFSKMIKRNVPLVIV